SAATPTRRERRIVALDLSSVAAAEAMIERLGDTVAFYKIGYQLAFAGGLPLARTLAQAGKQVFLDLKLHDIANTVAQGVESIAALGVTFLTIHGYPQTMRAAVEAKAGSSLKLLAVTVLTSYDDSALREAGSALGVGELVAERAKRAHDLGLDGIVCSAAEASALHLLVGNDMVLVTPGIRPAGSDYNDQKRVVTPARAIAAGARFLGGGRARTAGPRPPAGAGAGRPAHPQTPRGESEQ